MKIEKTNFNANNYDIGVIIGRFQVHDLHEAHRDLIETVIKRHKKVILFLGVSSVLATTHNPLDFTSRKRMIQDEFPDLNIIALPDQREDADWSETLDKRIREVFALGKVILYGGRDSFIPHYKGVFDCTELEQDIYVSGTEIRKQVSEEVKSSPLWRAGVIYQSYNCYPVSFQTVDIAMLSSDKKKILLARKPAESKLRFIGGFVDPLDESLESAARREFREETGGNAEPGDFQYVGSFRIDDWRYRSGRDKIMTALFCTTHSWGTLSPSDDISELRWVDIETFLDSKFLEKEIVPEHLPLAKKLISFLTLTTQTDEN